MSFEKDKSMKKWSLLAALLSTISISAATLVEWGGARSSSYGADPFPEDVEWTNLNLNIAEKVSAKTPTAIWIVGTINSDEGSCDLEFDQPEDLDSIPENINFVGSDEIDHDAMLDYFDTHGIKLFLQVEPALADLPTLMDIVMKQFGGHPCVAGFGFDIEWFNVPDEDHVNGGDNTGYENQVTKELASAWDQQLKAFNPNYTLFLKHWIPEYLAATEEDIVDDILYIDDTQGYGDIDELVSEFTDWSTYFDPSPVGFQFGYEKDSIWWTDLSDPVAEISDGIKTALDDNGSNQKVGMFWVDFTLQNEAVADLWDTNTATAVIPTSCIKSNATVQLHGRTLDFGQPMKSVKLFSPAGRMVKEISGSVTSIAIEPTLASGIYMIKSVSNQNREMNTQMLIR